jgi:hypothetical protein
VGLGSVQTWKVPTVYHSKRDKSLSNQTRRGFYFPCGPGATARLGCLLCTLQLSTRPAMVVRQYPPCELSKHLSCNDGGRPKSAVPSRNSCYILSLNPNPSIHSLIHPTSASLLQSNTVDVDNLKEEKHQTHPLFLSYFDLDRGQAVEARLQVEEITNALSHDYRK